MLVILDLVIQETERVDTSIKYEKNELHIRKVFGF